LRTKNVSYITHIRREWKVTVTRPSHQNEKVEAVSSGGRYKGFFVPTITTLLHEGGFRMKRFLGVLIASMFLASAAYAADAMKDEKTKSEKSEKAEKGEKAKGEKAKDSKAKSEKGEKAKGEKAKDTKDMKEEKK
jgi:hypothetical protein